MDLSSKKIGSQVNQRNTANQGSHTVGRMNQLGERAAMRHLTEGQVIKGEVTDLRNNQVSILLEDNTRVIGRLDDVNWLSIGDVGTFKVQSVEAGTIKLQAIPLSDSEMENNTMFKALEEAGLPHNSRNQSIVLSLIRNQLPITKPSILNILKQSYELKEASISTIVLLNKYNIPATHENASQFENYLSGNNALSKQLSQCIDNIPSLLRELVLFADDTIKDSAKQFLSLVHPETGQTDTVPVEDDAYIFSSNRIKNEILSILSDFDLPEETLQAISDNQLSASELTQVMESCYKTAQAIDARNQDNVLASLSPEELVNPMAVEEALAEVPKTVEAFDHPEFIKIQETFEEHLQNSQLTGGFFKETARSQLAGFLMQNPENSSLAKQVQSGDASLNALLDGIRNTIPSANGESLKQLFVSDEFMFLIRNDLKKQWSLSPDEIRKKENIGVFYQKVLEQVKGMEKLMNSISPDFQEGLSGSQLAEAKNNISFMQMLNNIFPYVQFPFSANGFQGNGELYVYTKRNELKRNPNQIKVLLHLSLEHLGNIDIHISKNGMILDNKFFIEDDQSKRLLKKNINLLSEKLQELGYSVTNEFEKKQTKPDLVKDFISQKETPSAGIKRYTFDIRA